MGTQNNIREEILKMEKLFKDSAKVDINLVIRNYEKIQELWNNAEDFKEKKDILQETEVKLKELKELKTSQSKTKSLKADDKICQAFIRSFTEMKSRIENNRNFRSLFWLLDAFSKFSNDMPPNEKKFIVEEIISFGEKYAECIYKIINFQNKCNLLQDSLQDYKKLLIKRRMLEKKIGIFCCIFKI